MRFRKIRKHGHTASKQQKQVPNLVFPDFPTPQTSGEREGHWGEREKGLSWQGSSHVVGGPPEAAGWEEVGIKLGG